MSKSIQSIHICMGYSNSGQKIAARILRKKPLKYSRNETMLNIGHLAKSVAFAWTIAFAKYSIWAKILNCLKHVKIDSVFNIGKSVAFAFCAKNSIWAPYLCKILTLSQNFKFPKTCPKRFCIYIGVIQRKKPLEKTSNIPKMTRY